MNSTFRPMVCGLFMFVGIELAGCGGDQTITFNPPVDQHDHEQVAHGVGHGLAGPESFADALKKFDKLRGEIKASFAAGDLTKADGPVHEVGHLLEELPESAAKESQSEAEQRQVRRAVDALMDSFAAIDERVHGGDTAGKSYEEVAARIDAAFAALNLIAKEESP